MILRAMRLIFCMTMQNVVSRTMAFFTEQEFFPPTLIPGLGNVVSAAAGNACSFAIVAE